MSTPAFLQTELLDDLDALEREVVDVYEQVVIPNREEGKPSLGRTVHAYMMALMTRVDLAATYWHGPGGSQTSRMIAFVGRYVCSDVEANRVLVKMWRHTLMYTGQPRQLLRSKGGDLYYWLLHWRESLSRTIHLTFLDEQGWKAQYRDALFVG